MTLNSDKEQEAVNILKNIDPHSAYAHAILSLGKYYDLDGNQERKHTTYEEEGDMVTFGYVMLEQYRKQIKTEMDFDSKMHLLSDILATYSALQSFILLPDMDPEQRERAKELAVRLATQSMAVWLSIL